MSEPSRRPVGGVWKLAFGGTAAIVIAGACEFIPSSPTLIAIRVLLSVAGCFAVGIACYLRPGHAKLYGLACVAAILARFGFPPEWDSTHILSGLAAMVAAMGALITMMPIHYRKITASALLLFHFGGIMVSVTSPMYPPWLTEVFGTLFYRPYLQSMYLTNAYHFYSPEPGPASQLWFCVKYKPRPNPDYNPRDSDSPKMITDVRWLKFPRRPDDMLDPLALSYYRRLSLTMRVEDAQPSPVTDDMKRARAMRAQGRDAIPFDPERWPLENQYIMPTDMVREFILPSYVRHVANMKEMQHPDGVTQIDTIRVYRVIHRILGPQFLQAREPYDPTTYEPFYLGEFNTQGRLSDPGDPMLYWMVPIIWIPDTRKGNIPSWHTPKSHPDEFILIDGVSIHNGGSDHNLAK